MTSYELTGPAIVGTIGELSKLIGYTVIGGVSNTATISGNGSVVIGGATSTISILGEGNVSIASSGTMGSSSIHSNNVLIGGTNTSLYSSGNVCIGPSTTSFHFEPSNPKLFIKDNPVVIETVSSLSSPGTISPSALSNGYIQFITTTGTYTFDSTSSIRNYLLDASATSFIGSPSPYFEVTFQNTTGGNILLLAGTGQTFLNNTSPYTLSNGSVTTFAFRFTSSTTMNIETPYNNTSLSSAGGTTTLVNNGTGPNLSIKGLTPGTAIGLTSSATNITIDNTGVTSLSGTTNQISVSSSTGAITVSLPNSVTISSSLTISGLTANAFLYSGTAGLLTTTAPLNGQLLIGSTGAAPVSATLTSGTGIGIANGTGSITISNTGVTLLSGTANQISVSSATGSVTISLPSAVTISTSLTISSLTANSFLYSGTGGVLTSTAAPTNGQLLIGSTGAAPTLATLTAGSGVAITNGAGSITITATGTAGVSTFSAGTTGLTPALATSDAITLAGTLSRANGGTGLSTAPTNGQLLIGNGTTYTLNNITAGTGITITNGAGTITIAASGGGGGVTTFSAGTTGFSPASPQSGAITLTGTLSIGSGGTGLTATPSNGQLLIGNGSGYTLNTITGGTGITVTNNAGTITISAVISNPVTSFSGGSTGLSPASPTTGAITLGGILSTGFGGTGTTSTPTNGQLLIGNGSGYTLNTISAGTAISVVNNAGTISINNTGVTALTAGTGVSISSSTGNVTVSATSNLATSGFCARLIADVTISTPNSIIDTSWSTTGNGRWNTGSNFNTLTGIYTVPATGIYNVSFSVSSNSASNVISLTINGSIEFSSIGRSQNSSGIGVGSLTLSLTSGQTLALISGATTTIYYLANNNPGTFGGTWFSIVRLT
jgi:hypothetical protein